MSTATKFMGLLAGVSAVAVIGVAVAQGVPPDDRIPNHPIAAGQQSSQHTAMGETGVPVWEKQVQTAIIVESPPRSPLSSSPLPWLPKQLRSRKPPRWALPPHPLRLPKSSPKPPRWPAPTATKPALSHEHAAWPQGHAACLSSGARVSCNACRIPPTNAGIRQADDPASHNPTRSIHMATARAEKKMLATCWTPSTGS